MLDDSNEGLALQLNLNALDMRDFFKHLCRLDRMIYEVFTIHLKKSKLGLDLSNHSTYITRSFEARGYSSAGRALHWQCRGRRFDPA